MISDNFIKVFPPVIGVMLFALCMFVYFVIHDTVVTNHPFETFNDRGQIVQYSDYNVFVYTRELTIKYDIYGSVDRVVIHTPSGRTIQLEPSGQFYKAAYRRPVYREFRLPKDLEKGEWCLYAYLKYKPGLSMKEHVFAAPKVCAYVN